ncbi:MAG: hypothetical protein KAU47_02945, partial [Candidatus Aminicenantes bacterium]|nr:hypothetical protein [Candidatus Aminicenantes bacterium]
MEAFKNAQFVMYCASQFPRVEIDEITVTPATDDLYWVDVAVKNDRVYPTSSDRAVQLKMSVKDTITVSASKNISVVEIPKGSTIIDPLNKLATSQPIIEKSAEFRLKGKETQRFCALVKMDGSQGWVEIQVKSQHGGTDTKRINLKVSR